MRERRGYYDFEINLLPTYGEYIKKWGYLIYGSGCQPYHDGIIESEEWYENEKDARDAAIANIDLLENGGGVSMTVISMKDFTKEELELLVSVCGHVCCYDGEELDELQNKLKSMIVNYCDHESYIDKSEFISL